MFTLIIDVNVGILQHPPIIPCYFSNLKYTVLNEFFVLLPYAMPNTGDNCIQYTVL